MRFKRFITAVDSHTEGMSTRVVISGMPYLAGKTMADKKEFVKKNLDYLRTALLLEPRGGISSYGVIMTPPVSREAAFGIVLMKKRMDAPYTDMCGHATMGVAVTALEMGIVEMVEPVTKIAIDTPAGLVHTSVNIENGKAKNVTLQTVPSFLYKTAVFNIPKLGIIHADIAFGGNFDAIIEAKDLGITTSIADIKKIGELIPHILQSINEQTDIRHPEQDHIRGASTVVISDKPTNPEAHFKNIAISGPLSFDRSPCGTGTSCRMATMYAKGELKLGETVVTESIIGSLFYGKLLKETRVGNLKAVIPEVTGRVFITGINQFIIDDDDPFKYGFVL